MFCSTYNNFTRCTNASNTYIWAVHGKFVLKMDKKIHVLRWDLDYMRLEYTYHERLTSLGVGSFLSLKTRNEESSLRPMQYLHVDSDFETLTWQCMWIIIANQIIMRPHLIWCIGQILHVELQEPVTMEPQTLLCAPMVLRHVHVVMALLRLRGGFHVLKAKLFRQRESEPS